MPQPSPRFADDEERLRVLGAYEPEAIEDDPELQAIVDFAARLCNAPVSMVSLIEEDRQHFLAKQGTQERETPREVAFCIHTLGQGELLEVPDTTRDPRFAENPLVTDGPGIRYYAGQPLVSEEGASLGTLCVIDTEARELPLDDFQRQGLQVLAQAAMRRLSARRARLSAKREIAEREERLLRMIDGVPQIAWSCDADGNFDYFNKRWREFTGADAPRLAEDWRAFIHPEDADETFAEWMRCVSEGEEFEREYRLKNGDGSWVWMLAQALPVAEQAGDPIRWFGTLTDIDTVRNALEERDLLAHELSHRIKNIFAVIIGLATLKVRKTPEHEPFARELTDVLRALGRAHEYVRPGGGAVHDSLQGLLTALFSPYGRGEDDPRVTVSGADADISARAATPLALVFHELATNSAKYGALSDEDGHVTLEVEDTGEQMRLVWNEHGGPRVKDTGERGFGSRLVEMSVTGQLEGSWERRFEEDGLVVELTVAKQAIAR